jgi:hypothetical protein
MNTRSFYSIEKESLEGDASPASAGKVCTSPAMGELLTDYIAELLADSIQEEVEDHLLDCLHCREKHLKVLSIGNALRSAKVARESKDEQSLSDERRTGGARVLHIADFMKAGSEK